MVVFLIICLHHHLKEVLFVKMSQILQMEFIRQFVEMWEHYYLKKPTTYQLEFGFIKITFLILSLITITLERYLQKVLLMIQLITFILLMINYSLQDHIKGKLYQVQILFQLKILGGMMQHQAFRNILIKHKLFL